jgi:hypothetical protein
MHLTASSRRSRSIGTGGRDPSEQVVTIVGMRKDGQPRPDDDGRLTTRAHVMMIAAILGSSR